jgi:hypothetical protein
VLTPTLGEAIPGGKLEFLEGYGGHWQA